MVKIDHAVIGRIGALAAREVPGVVGICEGLRVGGGWSWGGGVRVQMRERELQILLPLVVEYGVNLPRVAVQVQERVRDMVHRMTDLSAVEVEVRIREIREPIRPGAGRSS